MALNAGITLDMLRHKVVCQEWRECSIADQIIVPFSTFLYRFVTKPITKINFFSFRFHFRKLIESNAEEYYNGEPWFRKTESCPSDHKWADGNGINSSRSQLNLLMKKCIFVIIYMFLLNVDFTQVETCVDINNTWQSTSCLQCGIYF